MKVLVLGGDGYLGWPTALHLSARGYQVILVDSYMRRNLMTALDVPPLYPVSELPERVALWRSLTGRDIQFFPGDLRDWNFVEKIFSSTMPDAVVHYAEQPSAPFSMMDRESGILTIKNNLEVTTNLIYAVRDIVPDCHIVKLGTMGEYGTPNIDIEEGWIDINHNGRTSKFLYPRQSSSLYHTTKVMDTDLLWFFVRMARLRVTDLMQGPVYGISTIETDLDQNLRTFLSYDEIFGTVLNRFITQAASGYPLTVYGSGGQQRGYINIRDTVRCIELAIANPAERGELRIFNQFTEVFSVTELAYLVRDASAILGIDVDIQHVKNPRIEAEEHYYNPKNSGLLSLGLAPNRLTREILKDHLVVALSHKDEIRDDIVFRGVNW